jgi:phosphoglycolate phosphatase
MTPTTRSTVLFDLDGTLSASEPGIVASLVEALAAEGFPEPAADVLRATIGPPFAVGLPAIGVPVERVDDVVRRYRARYGETGLFDTTLYAGVVEMLDALRAAGLVVGLATSKSEDFARRVVAHLGIDGHLDIIAAADADGRRSDKASVVGHALDLAGNPPVSEIIMVGDRHHDVDGARAHGVDTILVAWGYGTADEHHSARPFAIAETPADVVRLVLG